MTVYLMISLPKMPYINRIYMVLANPKYTCMWMTPPSCSSNVHLASPGAAWNHYGAEGKQAGVSSAAAAAGVCV
jgi:hypothetical protein